MNLKKIGKLFTSKFVGTGPLSYKKRIYRATFTQRLRNTGVGDIRGSIHASVGVSFKIYRNHTYCTFSAASAPITTILPTGEQEPSAHSV